MEGWRRDQRKRKSSKEGPLVDKASSLEEGRDKARTEKQTGGEEGGREKKSRKRAGWMGVCGWMVDEG